ncbi:hypothetical protein [Streptomyces sp. NPDC007074]|uniref:hypothetical protein n=1 Tax=Streptomyces sp. NPDC007074 TaxID=3156764 RepID=UPI0033EBD5AB
MPVRPFAVAAAVTAASVSGVLAVRRHRSLRRALLAERAVRRLEGAAHIRDVEAWMVRFREQLESDALLREADLVLDSALATHHNPEGGSQ